VVVIIHRRRRWRAGALVVATGLAIGAATSFGQGHLGGASNALVNSVSAWLVAPFAAGALMAARRGAALAGLTVAVLEVAGYYVTADLRGFANGPLLIAFWLACGVAGGPLFGAAGRVWRGGDRRERGLGGALVPAVFAAEGLWLDLHEQHDAARAGLWLGCAAVAAAVLLRRPAERRWLAPALTCALLGEVALTGVTARGLI
jgi:hypothetical protein